MVGEQGRKVRLIRWFRSTNVKEEKKRMFVSASEGRSQECLAGARTPMKFFDPRKRKKNEHPRLCNNTVHTFVNPCYSRDLQKYVRCYCKAVDVHSSFFFLAADEDCGSSCLFAMVCYSPAGCEPDVSFLWVAIAAINVCAIVSNTSYGGTVVSLSGAKKRHEKIERHTTPVVVPFSLMPYITASAVENGTRNRTTHRSSGGAIFAPLVFLSFCDLVGYMCTNGTIFSRANGCLTKYGVVRFLVPLSILLT
nr:hypothetical protein [Tanacetum cinerariifolium]